MTVRVSDHALLGWLAQAGGLDVAALRAELERSLGQAHDAVAAIGGGDCLVSAAGVIFILRDGVVTKVVRRRASVRARGLLLDHPGRP